MRLILFTPLTVGADLTTTPALAQWTCAPINKIDARRAAEF
jgi:hypothetical protein